MRARSQAPAPAPRPHAKGGAASCRLLGPARPRRGVDTGRLRRARSPEVGRGGRGGAARGWACARDADGLTLQDAARAQAGEVAPEGVEGVAVRLWAAGT